MYRDLEEEMGVTTNLTGKILGRWGDGEAAGVGMREIKESVCRSGKVWMVERCEAKAPLVAEVAQWVSWAKVWDASIDFGIGCSRGMQALVRVMCHHGQGSQLCPLCDCPSLYEDSLYAICWYIMPIHWAWVI